MNHQRLSTKHFKISIYPDYILKQWIMGLNILVGMQRNSKLLHIRLKYFFGEREGGGGLVLGIKHTRPCVLGKCSSTELKLSGCFG